MNSSNSLQISLQQILFDINKLHRILWTSIVSPNEKIPRTHLLPFPVWVSPTQMPYSTLNAKVSKPITIHQITFAEEAQEFS